MNDCTISNLTWKQHPPEALLRYDYCRNKTLKCFKKLHKAKCPFDIDITIWDRLLKNQVILIHKTAAFEDRLSTSLRNIFDEDVCLQESDMKLNDNKKAAECIPATDGIFKYRVPLVIIDMETEEDIMPESLNLLRSLKTWPSKTLKQIMFYVSGQNVGTGIPASLVEELKELEEINYPDGNLNKLQDRLGKALNALIDRIENKCKERKIDLQKDTGGNEDELREIISVSDTFANIKRILKGEGKGNGVSEKLQLQFDKMQEQGYVGHVFLHERLIIYFKSTARQKDMEDARNKAQEYFVDVCTSKLTESSEIKQYTMTHDDPVQTSTHRGRLGGFAKIHQPKKTVAISSGHFAQKTDVITMQDSVIGHCIYPSSDYRHILSNGISVIDIGNHEVTFKHEHINGCLKRVLFTDNTKPVIYSKVFKGRSNMGFITGTIISTDFLFRGLSGYLVEGDDDIPFAGRGDCGVVVKLQKLYDDKLIGVSMVTGGVLKIDHIDEDTTVTIPLPRAIAQYESDTGNTLSFDP